MRQAAGRAADYEAARQTEKIRAFVEAWNDFAKEWTENGTYNVKKAKRVRKAWDDLDATRFFPR